VDDPAPRNLPRWIGAGILAGLIVIAVAAAAYAVGYHRGKNHERTGAASATTSAPAATSPTTTARTTSTAPSTVALTPALIAQGKRLYSDGCSSCHSLTGSPGAGPSFKGLAGSSVALDTGQTVTADDAYLRQSITDPDAQIVKGYHSGLMTPAISGFGLAKKPDQVTALVAFIKSQK
jgi:mono/diheme cytochrome c family protein